MLCQECVRIKPSEQTGETQCQLSRDMKDQPAFPKAHPMEQQLTHQLSFPSEQVCTACLIQFITVTALNTEYWDDPGSQSCYKRIKREAFFLPGVLMIS